MRMFFNRIICGVGLVGMASLGAFGQKESSKKDTPSVLPSPLGQPGVPPVEPCPTLQVHASVPTVVREGAPIRFTANLAGNLKVAPSFSWSVSSGTMTSGQGTSNIEVDTTGAGADKAITATVMIGGLASDCTYMGETTIKVAGPARKVYEYGEVPDEQQTRWLDSLTAALAPDEHAYIIVYAGRTSLRGASMAELKKIRAHVLKGGTPGDRFLTVDGGYRETPGREFWLVPIGAAPPSPTPTIAARDIVFPKPVKPVKKP
ncbi:MAG: hypothetical protein WKF34_09775 [Pyrinomonadaceae bacterium]